VQLRIDPSLFVGSEIKCFYSPQTFPNQAIVDALEPATKPGHLRTHSSVRLFENIAKFHRKYKDGGFDWRR
jgi:hypothetical protein